MKFLGLVEASVVGLSHLFRTAADSNGAQLKKLAAFLGKSCEKAYGFLEIVLIRNKNVPADANAVSVLVSKPNEFSEGGNMYNALSDTCLLYSSMIQDGKGMVEDVFFFLVWFGFVWW